jgi:hypothetical protein
MSQNPQINAPTENNQPFFNNYPNGLQHVNQLDQPSSNIFHNENTACSHTNNFPVSNKILPVHHATSFAIDGNVDSTLQNYTTISSNDVQYNNTNNGGQAIIQNSPQYFMNISPSEIITYEIPGYSVIYIPKPSPFVTTSSNLNMQQQISDSSNSSSSVNQTQLNQFYGTSSPANAINNTHSNNQFPITDSSLQYQHNFNNFRG